MYKYYNLRLEKRNKLEFKLNNLLAKHDLDYIK